MADPTLTVNERLDLITRGIPPEDVHGISEMEKALSDNTRMPRCLWVTSPTGKPHVGYYVPLLKFADILKAGCEITVVLLDVYSYLDNVKHPWDKVRERMFYYKYIVEAALESVGIPTTNIRFVEESSYHFSKEWVKDQWRLCTLVPQQAVKDAWDRSYNPDMLSPMFCPGIQTLAEEHLDIDFQFGGKDQAGIFAFAEKYLPQLGYRQRGRIMNPMIPNLHGGKMSSSHPPETKIMFLDDDETVTKKIAAAPWNEIDSTKNGVLCLVENVLIPAARLQLETNNTMGSEATAPNGAAFTVESNGKPHTFNTYPAVEEALKDGTIQPDDVKDAVSKGLNRILEHVRRKFNSDAEWQANEKAAYPEEA